MVQARDPQPGAEAPHLTARPAPPPGSWAALDADYRDGGLPPPERLTQLPTVGFSGRFWKVPLDVPSDPRVRLERPVLLAWLLISCFWQGFIPWAVMGFALIAYAFGTRGAFRQYGLRAETWLCCALGLGQIMLACSFIADLGLFWPFIGLYWVGLILAWILIEARNVFGKRGGRSVF